MRTGSPAVHGHEGDGLLGKLSQLNAVLTGQDQGPRFVLLDTVVKL